MNKTRNTIIISVNIALAVLLLLISSSCVFVGVSRTIYGNGKIGEKIFNQAYFDAVSVGGNWTVDIQQDRIFSVRIEADENLFSYLDISVYAGMLYVGFKKGYSIDHARCKVFITMPVLRKLNASGTLTGTISSFNMPQDRDTMAITISGSGNIKADNSFVRHISVDISGSGSFEASGNAFQVTANISGSGNIKADNLKTAYANIAISGSGSADVWVTDILTVDISGSGFIRYRGNPYVRKISNRGKVYSF